MSGKPQSISFLVSRYTIPMIKMDTSIIFMPPVWLLLVGATLSLYLLYRTLLPCPLPNIPYNENSTKQLFGDIPQILKAKYRRHWIWSQPQWQGAPVVQAFLKAFQRPVVIISDYREVVDICSRRMNEFDRGTKNREIMGLIAPNFHMTMNTSDPRFKLHRGMLRDLMTPSFLQDTSAPRIYARTQMLVNLWKLKHSKGHGRPFEAKHDLYLAMLDTICSVAFDMEDDRTALARETEHVQSLSLDVFHSANDAVDFPPATQDPEIEALLDIPDMLAIAQSSPLPRFSQMLALLKPKHAKAWWNRRALIRRQTTKCLEKQAGSRLNLDSALDQLLLAERNSAVKANRAPNFYSPVIRDEILGYILGGHDTSATVVSWWVKYMSRDQGVQQRLRAEIQRAHAGRRKRGEWPSMQEIIKTPVTYLDAVIEETLRYAAVATLIVRMATRYTEILGYPIPKGTSIMLPLTGPSMKEPALEIAEELRTEQCQKAKDRVRPWGDDLRTFNPNRWLRCEQNEEGIWEEHFDSQAGPSLAFSSGPRQCFGKKLAYMKLRTLMTLLLWNFEFGEVAKEFDGDDIIERLVNLPKDCYVKLSCVE